MIKRVRKIIILSTIFIFVAIFIVVTYSKTGDTVYFNEKYGYTISIPYSYKAVAVGGWGSQNYLKEIPAQIDSDQVYIYPQDIKHPEESTGISIRVAAEITGTLTPNSICVALDGSACGDDFSFEPLELGGGKGFKRIAPTGYIKYLVQKDENSPILVISIGYELDKFQDKILSTFKFIE